MSPENLLVSTTIIKATSQNFGNQKLKKTLLVLQRLQDLKMTDKHTVSNCI